MKFVEKLNVAQKVTATLTSPTVSMMLNDDRCLYAVSQTTVVTTAVMYSVITANTLATFPRTVLARSFHQEHHGITTGCTPNHITSTVVGTDPSPSPTDAAKEDSLTGQDHTINPPCQKLQQLSEACIWLLIPPLQQFVIPIKEMVL